MFSRIDLKLTPSRGVGVLASIPWILLLAFVTVTGMEVSASMLALIPIVVAGGIWQARRTGLLRGSRAVVGLSVRENQLYALLGSGLESPVFPAADSRIGSTVTLLKLKLPGATFGSCLVFLSTAGSLFTNTTPEDFRRLRVWLRLGEKHSGTH